MHIFLFLFLGMGVPGLLPMIKEYMEYIPVENLQGTVIGVDAYSWLYKAASAFAFDLYDKERATKGMEKCVGLCIRKCKTLMEHGITLYFVFDGEEHPMKKDTSQKRRERKENARERVEELLSKGKRKEALSQMARCVKVDRVLDGKLICALEAEGIRYMRAPYEADPQLAYLERICEIDYIATEDSDLIVYGAKKVLFKLNESIGADYFDREKILQHCPEPIVCLLNMIKEIVALSGCDYTNGIKQVGLVTAHKLMMVHRTARECIMHLGKRSADALEHLNMCARVVYTFTMHVVIDPQTKRRRYLEEPMFSNEEDVAVTNDFSFVGSLIEDAVVD